MASKSNPLDSTPLSTYFPSSGGSIKTNDGTKQVQPLTSKSKCAIAAFVVGGVAGVVIIILGTTNLFGPVGSIGFIASVAGGGTVAVIATGGLIWIAISNCKQAQDSVNDYEFSTLKQIADSLIKDVYYRKFVRSDVYEIKFKDIGDTVKHTQYPTTKEEIQEYEQKIPSIVDTARRQIEQKLKISIPIPRLLDTLAEHHSTLFPYIF
jgi:hypothetical protein